MLNVSSRKLYRVYATSIIAALGMAMISISNLNSSPSAAFAVAEEKEQEHKFTTKLTGSEEVPRKTTNATGTAEFILEHDGKTLSYKISVKDIHCFAHVLEIQF
jgi:pullulanase/glycogen debranching enzyme